MTTNFKHIIFVTGYPGAGKTTTVKNLMADSTHHQTWLRTDTPFAVRPLRGVPRAHHIGSSWAYQGMNYVVAGCHRKAEPNKQGADIFVSMPKYEAIGWLLDQGDTLIWDSFDVSAKMVSRLQEHRLTYIFIDEPREVCMQRRDGRRDITHHSSKRAEQLIKFYDKADANWEKVSQLPFVKSIRTATPLATLKDVL